MDGATRSKQTAAASAARQLGWLPARVRAEGGALALDWRHFGAKRLTEPFYEDSAAAIQAGDPDRLITTPLTDTAAWPARLPSLEPSGLIFHMSRCGSTLITQMLAACDANLVVSEAGPIDAVVRADLAPAQRIALLRAMAGALGQVRNAGETRYFIKLDSWHACALPLFRAAFPATPWVFIYRDPAAVMVSHTGRVGAQLVSDLVSPAFYGLDPGGQTWGVDYYARVLGAICAAAAREYAGGGGLMVNYSELPRALWTRILPHFGVAPSAPEVQRMAAAARFDAKAPGRRFEPDVAAKRLATTAAIEYAVERSLAEVYGRLEALRSAVQSPARRPRR